MKVTIPDKVSKTAASMFEKAGISVDQKPGIEIDECSDMSKDADAVIVRSYKLHDLEFGDRLRAIGRAGAGVNNIPVEKCTRHGIVVFNTPGANANGVKELIFCGMFLSARKIVDGINWTKTIKDTGSEAPKLIEKNKAQFKGTEIKGKNLGVIGLGAIGMLTANDAAALGMNVSAFTRTFTEEKLQQLSPAVKRVDNFEDLLPGSDYLSLNIAINDETNGFINKDAFAKMKPGVRIMNFARNELVNTDDLLEAIGSGIVDRYVTDFPNAEQISVENIIAIPHLGASTAEAEENCAVMVSNQLIDYLQNGNIKNSVNFPNCSLERGSDNRIAFVTQNDSVSSGDLQSMLERSTLTIRGTVAKSRGDISYTIAEASGTLSDDDLNTFGEHKGVISVRRL